MSFHVKRTTTAHLDTVTAWDGAKTSRWVRPADGQSVLEILTVSTPQVFLNVPEEKNDAKPPYHWHWYQEETFTVREGYAVTSYRLSQQDLKCHQTLHLHT